MYFLLKKVSFLLYFCVPLILCSFMLNLVIQKPAYAYSMKDVDNFIVHVKGNPSEYGADFTNGDKVYKEQFTRDGKIGYNVFLDKNSIISQDFDGWVIVSEGP